MSALKVEWHHSGIQTRRSVIVALHGFFGSPEDWRPMLEPFTKSHDLCLITLPGHGRHEVSSELFTFDGISRELARILSPYHASKRIILGYSLGGRIAAHAVLTEQLSVAGIGILSGHLGLESIEKRWERVLSDEIAAYRLQAQPLEDILQEWYTLPLFAHDLNDNAALNAFVSRRVEHDSSELPRASCGFSLGWQSDLRGLIPHYSGKLLYLAGEKDEAYRNLAQEVFALHPGRRARILPDAGHDLLGEASRKPQVMSQLQSEIADFLDDIGKESQ